MTYPRNIYRAVKISMLFFVFGFLFISCRNDSQEQDQAEESKEEPGTDEFHLEGLEQLNDPALERWTEFYQQQDTAFQLSEFEPADSVLISPMKGTVKTASDPRFDTVYTPFLVYAPDSSQYIDIDSYLWRLDADGEPSFEVDQEINLVDIESDSVARIGFLGPSYRIEEAIWLDESHILLLGKQDGNQPYLQHLNLETWRGRTFRYPNTIPSDSSYREQVIRSRLK